MKKVNIAEKLNLFEEKWTPKIVADLNGQHVKLAKIQGDFVFHNHANEDELFYILKGELYMDFEDHTVELGAGDMIVVPAGVEHRPRTKDGQEVHLMLVEPHTTKHTGEVEHELTKHSHDWI
ncbi:MAG: cupin domain-containing protein [Bacteroidota bacterium]